MVEFVDTSKEVIKTLQKLTKKALRDGGKAVTPAIKSNTLVRSARLQNTVYSAVSKSRSTGQVYLGIGYLSKGKAKKKGLKVAMANPAWLEFGVKPHEIKAGVKSSRGKVRSETGKKTLTDGIIDYGSKVQHPGYRGRNTLRNTVMANIAEIQKAQEKTLALLSQELDKINVEDVEEEEID